MSAEKEQKNCECGGTLAPQRMKLEEFEGGKLFVINEAPVMVCQTCGEVWVPETIIDEFEKMIQISKERQRVRIVDAIKEKNKQAVKRKARSRKPSKKKTRKSGKKK